MNSALQAWLDDARRAWRASPAPRFLAWWAGELAALLPARWRAWFLRGPEWYLLLPQGTGWTLCRAGVAAPLLAWDPAADERSQGAALHRVLNGVERADRRLALLLPPALVLRRSLTLPSAARNDLTQALGFEMDRQTPFTVAEVYFAARREDTPSPAGTLRVELVAVPRTTLHPMLARLVRQGLTVDAVDVAAAAGNGEGMERLGVNLLPPKLRPRHARPRLRGNVALAAGCVLLLGIALGQWLGNREAALAHMRSSVAALGQQAAQELALRAEWRDSAGASAFLASRRQKASTTLAVLDDVTARFPDSAWLERLTIDAGGQLTLQGQGTQAASLLDALRGSRLVEDAKFQGSIQPDPATDQERFYLVARVRTPAAVAATAARTGGSGAP